MRSMNPPWVTVDTSFLSPPCAVPKYYKFNSYISFWLSISPSTNLQSTSTISFPRLDSGLLTGLLSLTLASLLLHYSHRDLLKRQNSSSLHTFPYAPPLLGWLLMVQKTLAALFVWSPRPIWDPSHVPNSSHTITLVLCDYSTLLEFSCPWTDRAPFQHRTLECALFCYLCSSPDYIFTSQIKHLVRKPSLTSPMMGTISLSFAVLSTNLQCFQLFD